MNEYTHKRNAIKENIQQQKNLQRNASKGNIILNRKLTVIV